MSFLVQKRAFFVQILPENDKNGSETGAPGAGVQPVQPDTTLTFQTGHISDSFSFSAAESRFTVPAV